MKVHIQSSTCCWSPLSVFWLDAPEKFIPFSYKHLNRLIAWPPSIVPHFIPREGSPSVFSGSVLTFIQCFPIFLTPKKVKKPFYLTSPGQFILIQPFPESLSNEFVCIEMIHNHVFALEVIRSFNCCTERGFSAVVLNKLGNWNHFRGSNHWLFVDRPVDVLSLFYQVIFPSLFTRLFLMHLRKSKNLKVV